MSTKARPAPPECAQCCADIPPKALACPGCGADERTGWREASVYDGIDLPDDRFARKKPMSRAADGLAWHWWAAGVLLVIVLAASAFAIV